MQLLLSLKLLYLPRLKVFVNRLELTVVTIRFKAVGRAPILIESKQRGQIGSDQKFGAIGNHLRRQLKLKPTEALVRYL